MVEVMLQDFQGKVTEGDAASPLLAWTHAFEELSKKSHYPEATGSKEAQATWKGHVQEFQKTIPASS